MYKELESYIGKKKVVVEAGHIQAKTTPSVEQTQGVELAMGILANLSVPAHKTVLVDDRIKLVKSGDLTSYVTWLADHGYKPDTVFLESELFKPAMELYEELGDLYPYAFLAHMPTRGRRAMGEGLRTYAGFASLLTPSGEPSVELMDAALYLEEQRLGDVSLKVLPQMYMGEQRKTMALLKKAKKELPAAQVFFKPGDEGVIVKRNR